ncbi:hypothetical protein ACFL2B_00195 [Patescibacteria group bacterium]
MSEINFTIEDKKYKVGMEAYKENLFIKLPDGRVVEAYGWSSTKDGVPTPRKIMLVECAEAVEVEQE